MDLNPSETRELLKRGGFTTKGHPEMADDIRCEVEDDPGCWNDICATLNRIRSGTCRDDDEWDAPLDRRYADIGEIKRRRGHRLYRLYVCATGPNELCLLAFAWKTTGKAGLQIQNQQIDVAYRRLKEL